MQSLLDKELLGYVELQVGSLQVQVPIRAASDKNHLSSSSQPLATFAMEGETCAILVRGDATSKQIERAMQDAARDAVRALSRKLLN
jgi:hypothetical protein